MIIRWFHLALNSSSPPACSQLGRQALRQPNGNLVFNSTALLFNCCLSSERLPVIIFRWNSHNCFRISFFPLSFWSFFTAPLQAVGNPISGNSPFIISNHCRALQILPTPDPLWEEWWWRIQAESCILYFVFFEAGPLFSVSSISGCKWISLFYSFNI